MCQIHVSVLLLHCRCHTFGIGSDVCLELVTGVAAISGGRCILLKEGERLQTKVSVAFGLFNSIHCFPSHAQLCNVK